MTANAFQLLSVSVLTILAGVTMVTAGTRKKLLGWKKAPRRCPQCGRTDRHNCACRR